jgi:type II secretory pathway pseudopilin PulG
MWRLLKKKRNQAGFTLTEALIAMALVMLSMVTVVTGVNLAMHHAELAAYQLAGQAQAMRGLEQVRAAKWDPLGYPAVDQVQNGFFPARVEILDVPMVSGNITYATNFTTITTVSADPPLRMVRVDCVWGFLGHRLYTNTLFTYRAPDQ